MTEPTQWREDWDQAPKGNNKRFLVLIDPGPIEPLITTAYFYWYTEGGPEPWSQVEYWALQDAVQDQPLDEAGPIETLGYKWMPIPK